MIWKDLLKIIEASNDCYFRKYHDFHKRKSYLYYPGVHHRHFSDLYKNSINSSTWEIGKNKGSLYSLSKRTIKNILGSSTPYTNEQRLFHVRYLEEIQIGRSIVFYLPEVKFSQESGKTWAGVYVLKVTDKFHEGVNILFTGIVGKRDKKPNFVSFEASIVYDKTNHLEPFIIEAKDIPFMKNGESSKGLMENSEPLAKLALTIIFFLKNPEIDTRLKDAKVFKGKTEATKKSRGSHEFIFVGDDWKSETIFRRNITVTGHWRNQPYGPGRTLRKRIWIKEFKKGDFKIKSGKERAKNKIKAIKRGQKISRIRR